MAGTGENFLQNLIVCFHSQKSGALDPNVPQAPNKPYHIPLCADSRRVRGAVAVGPPRIASCGSRERAAATFNERGSQETHQYPRTIHRLSLPLSCRARS